MVLGWILSVVIEWIRDMPRLIRDMFCRHYWQTVRVIEYSEFHKIAVQRCIRCNAERHVRL